MAAAADRHKTIITGEECSDDRNLGKLCCENSHPAKETCYEDAHSQHEVDRINGRSDPKNPKDLSGTFEIAPLSSAQSKRLSMEILRSYRQSHMKGLTRPRSEKQPSIVQDSTFGVFISQQALPECDTELLHSSSLYSRPQ